MKIYKTSKNILNNQRGQATFETVPLLLIFVIFIGYGIGAFGIVHTGILHSIAARTYAFETFRHRANLIYFRENATPEVSLDYAKRGRRLHGIANEQNIRQDYIVATERQVNFGFINEEVGRSENIHNQTLNSIAAGTRSREDSAVNPAWIKVQYGICINALCSARGQGGN